MIVGMFSCGKDDGSSSVPQRPSGGNQADSSRDTVLAGIPAVELTTEVAAIFPSKGEMRKLTQGGGVSINKEKLAAPDTKIDTTYLLNNKYIIVQRGKKNYYLLIAK